MTAKEKALELYGKGKQLAQESDQYGDVQDHVFEQAGRDIALFVVDEIIAACEYNHVESYNTDWWDKVKKEIESL